MLYKILDTKTGLYYAGGGHFSETGKTYSKKQHLTAGMTLYENSYVQKRIIPDTWKVVAFEEIVVAQYTVEEFRNKGIK